MSEIKYRKLLEELKGRILTQKYEASRPFPSERALIRSHGVSRTTVQYALRELERQGLLYRRPGAGWFITRIGARRKIGLIVPGIGYSEIYPPIVSEISRLSQQADYQLLFGDIPCDEPEGWLAQAETFVKNLIDSRAAGVILQPLELFANSNALTRQILQQLTAAGIPVVQLGYGVGSESGCNDYDVVGINNVLAGEQVARYLLSIGKRRIHFFARNTYAQLPTGSDRISGLASVLGPRLFDRKANVFWADSGDAAAIRRYVKAKNVEVFVCGNDAMAAELWRTLETVGIRVPDDVMLVGFDDVRIASLMGLTSVLQPVEEIARVAFGRLMARVKDPSLLPLQMFVSSPLAVRQSTAVRKREKKGKCK